MSRSVGFAHIIRQDDGTVAGVWGNCTLRSAFQPIFAFSGGKLKIAAFEGLIRPFKEGRSVPPGQFFASVPPEDRMHVETLARTLHLLNGGRFLDRRALLFINFDPSVFVDRGLTDTVLRDMRLVLPEAGIAPDRIVCEVTEKKSASESVLTDFVSILKHHGFRIAVDDYGSDESDIGRIERLRPDIVKFDAQWITSLMRSGPGFALLEEMVARFRARDITTVFEGIEEGWQLDLAERSGASMVQGYVLARPDLAPANFAQFPFVEAEAAVEEAAIQHAEVPPTYAAIARPGRPVRAFGRRA